MNKHVISIVVSITILSFVSMIRIQSGESTGWILTIAAILSVFSLLYSFSRVKEIFRKNSQYRFRR